MKNTNKIKTDPPEGKQAREGFLMITKGDAPIINDIYDTMTYSHDGTITPNAPIIIKGEHLRLSLPENVDFCLAPVINRSKLINVSIVCKYTDTQIIVLLPYLEPGEYYPAIVLNMGADLKIVYILPESWIVHKDAYKRVLARRYYNTEKSKR